MSPFKRTPAIHSADTTLNTVYSTPDDIMSAPGPIDEVTAPVKVGAGSFGAVFVVRGGPVAFKIAHVLEHHETLRREYEALTYLYGNSTSFFRIPKPFAFHYSQDNILLAAQPTLRSPPNTRTVYRQPAPVDRSFFDVLQNDNPVYAMSRVFALPANIGAQISAKFLPDGITAGPNLLRLYFGKTLASNNSPRFINTANFPMDLFRYEWLRTVVGEKLRMDLPSAEEVALEIGETLGRIHWSGGYDGRDIEFVMGGDGFANVEFYVIDFNQVCRLYKGSNAKCF